MCLQPGSAKTLVYIDTVYLANVNLMWFGSVTKSLMQPSS